MAKSIEMFGQFTYGPELSYNELMEAEAFLRREVANTLQEHSAEFVHFEGLGSILRVQCVFRVFGEGLFHALCEAFAPLAKGDIEARFLFVDKNLDKLALYTLSAGQWRESLLDIPPAGPIGKQIQKSAYSGK